MTNRFALVPTVNGNAIVDFDRIDVIEDVGGCDGKSKSAILYHNSTSTNLYSTATSKELYELFYNQCFNA